MNQTRSIHRPMERTRETRAGSWEMHGPYCLGCSARHGVNVPWPCRRKQAQV